MITDFSSFEQITYNIIGAAMEVHSVVGFGLLEPIYNEALHIELIERNIPNIREQRLPCYYKEHTLGKYYQADIIADNNIIIEIKSVSEIAPQHRKQIINYLRLTKIPIGLLINFGQKSLQCSRYGYDNETNDCYLLDSKMNIQYRKEMIF